MVQFKKLTTSLPGGTNTHTFTDALINDASVIEVYTNDDEVYPVDLEQHGNSIDVTLSDHPDTVEVALTINNVVTYEPTDISGLEDDISTLGTMVTDLETTKQDVLTPGENITIENNVISATGGADERIDYYEQNGFLSKNLIEKIYEQGQPSSDVNSRVRVKKPIKIKQGKKYSFKFTTDISNGQYIVLTSSKKDYLWTETTYCGNVANWGINDYTFTATNDGYLAIAFRKSNNATITVSECEETYIMASESETALDYIPYAPSNIEIKKMIDEGGGGGGDNYSTEEQRIGTWFGKPLYRKVFISDNTNSSLVINTGINIDILKNADTWILTSSGWLSGNMNLDANSRTLTYITENNEISSGIVGWNRVKTIIVLEYTKVGE